MSGHVAAELYCVCNSENENIMQESYAEQLFLHLGIVLQVSYGDISLTLHVSIYYAIMSI